MEILNLRPALKEIIWGGNRMKEQYGFQTDAANIAEAWMLSAHKDGPSVVVGGEDDGLTLLQAVEKHGKEVLGTKCASLPDFPLLVKFIDARDRLSVQVHPENEYARRVENENGKTEAWYILDCDEGAELIYGFNGDLTKEECRNAIEQGTLLEKCNRVAVKPGDVCFIPAGTLHAIGAGILLAEVQQSSNVTYRVFDYNRVGKDGKQRELHVDKALDVVHLNKPSRDFSAQGAVEKIDGGTCQLLAGCEYFSMHALVIDGECSRIADETSFVSILVTDGSGTLTDGKQTLDVKKGSCFFIPANHGSFTLAGNLKAVEIRV
ncbi:MAG: class I mannose-6-phosphate isomerase [Clostridia bacterium]|nr:class I mannose-6-phosphate isomerase [Clostridia bacterium]